VSSSSRKNIYILLIVILSASTFSVLYLNSAGHNDDNIRLLQRLTARLSFMIYLLIFIARPLRQMFKTDTTLWLVRERRSFGIAFAAMHSVHLGLIVYRFSTIPGLSYGVAEGLIGGTAYVLMYLMLLTSFDGPARALGPLAWRRLHKFGLYYIGAIFISTLLPEQGDQLLAPERVWFVVLTSAALIVRLTAYFATHKHQGAPD
jgi:DMSO/TMAO reductase YedYZ heme-binding membrane subunit